MFGNRHFIFFIHLFFFFSGPSSRSTFGDDEDGFYADSTFNIIKRASHHRAPSNTRAESVASSRASAGEDRQHDRTTTRSVNIILHYCTPQKKIK